jgi:hypothetical protein
MPLPIETWKALAPWYNVDVPVYVYLLFLPIIAPFTLLTYAKLFHTKKDPLRTALAIFFIAYLVFFSIPKGKEIRFILPALAPAAILAADFLENNLGQSKKYFIILYTIITLTVSLVIIKGAYSYYLPLWYFDKAFPFLSP